MAPGPIPGSVGPLEVQEAPYVMTSSPRKSMSVSTKGLLNMPGQNNCFLNSAVQVLWHLDIFRRSFRELASHACMAESCIFCALKELFTQFQYSQESALPPDALRHALAKTFCDQRRFQLGFMDDAAECFENILLRIHVHIANQESDDMCGNAQCIPHQKFAMTLVEQRVCHNCGSTTEPLPFTQMVHYVTTSALCVKSQESKEQDFRTQTSFGTLLRLAGDMGEVRDCQSGCGSKIHVKKTLMNHPEVVSVGLVWDSECPTLQHITDVFYSIGMYLRLPDMFNAVYDMERASGTMHQLVGVVTYYGKHYSTFFFHTKLRVWIYFDDATVREVGPSWEQVVEKCQRGRFQPLLLLFANPKGSASLPQSAMQDCNASFTMDPSGKSARAANQRQAVIRQYLMFQNSHPNFTSKNRYSGIISSPHTYPYSYDNQPKHMDHKFHNYEHTFQEKINQPPPVYNNLQSISAPVYSNLQSTAAPVYSNLQSTAAPVYSNLQLTAPVYSNLQQLNSNLLQYQQDRTSLSKLNEISLATPQVENPDVYNAATKSYDISNVKKDFDMSKDSDSAFTEEDPESNDMYISRKQVESVLNLQKRQMSLCRSYSQSSVGNRNSSSSLESFDNHHIVAKTGVVKNQQVENLANRRDSGTWSSDRNSSSSNNSVENPFLTVVASKRLLLGLNGLPKGPPSDHTSDHGYDSFSVSSSDSYPSINGSPVKLDPRLTQIPEDWLPEESTDLDKKLKLVTEDTSGPPDCDKLCAEADLLLAKSHEKEKDGDLVMAALLCDSAAARARQAMEAPYNNSRSLVSAKMKHSTCVMRSSCLYRRLKDHEMDERRKQKGHHSRQGSRDSTHSRHSRQGSKDSTHSKSGSNKDGNNQSDEAENFGKNIEIYGTLPKKSRKKVSGTTSVVTTKAKDDQVYKDFLDKQRKNTSLSDALSETLQKNVEVPQNRSENVTKSKLPVTSDKHHRKGSGDGIPPKSPNRRKSDSPVKSDPEVRKKGQKPLPVEQAYVGLFPSSDYNEMARDLLSPMSSPDKKQHKIKRKLMGGFMKRKNRSMPDLREDQDISDPLDRSFDDAIIPATMTLPNGKLKKLDNPADSGLGNMSRGFHQPHFAFVKKDLNHQRPLLTKVNPPSVLPSPKIKLIHSLPSLPKKPVELSSSGIAKPSKIPFISTLPKHETAALPPLQSPKLTDIKPLPKPLILKTSAIPVLTPQVPLSMFKPNSIKEEALCPQQTNEQTIDKEDLPQPTNSFLSEIQAKRKQVLLKSQPKKESSVEDQHESPTMINRDTTSMLPKLALQGEGTLWLKELQSKQKQLLNKNEDLAVGLPRTVNSHEKIKAVQSLSFSNHKDPEKLMVSKAVTVNHRNTKISPQTDTAPQGDSERFSSQTTTTSNKTANSVKDLASRFEKVMIIKPKDTTESVNANVSSQDIESIKPPATFNQKLNANSNKEVPNQTVISPIQDKEVIPHINVPQLNTYPLKSALKTKSEGINVIDSFSQEQSNNALTDSPRPNGSALETIAVPKPIVGFKQPGLDSNVNSSSAVSKPIKPALKQSGLDCTDSSSDLSKPVLDPSASGSLAGVSKPIKPALKQASVDSTFSQRPMQPPDYATAMQRIELIRTSNGDGQQLKQPNFEYQVASSGDSSPRKKQGGKKKSVTFSDEVVLVACAEYDEIDFSSNPLFERVYQQHMESGKGEIPNLPPLQEHDNGYGSVPTSETGLVDTADNQTNSNAPSSCNLCHNKYVIPPSTYCTDCEFYLSRFKA